MRCFRSLVWVPWVAACSAGPVSHGPAEGRSLLGVVAAEPQRQGDPAAGYSALVNRGYVSCGVPYSAYTTVYPQVDAADLIPGREGKNAMLAYGYSAFTTSRGVLVVAPNCLYCHAGTIEGKLVIGLGNTDLDFTLDRSEALPLAAALVTDPAERAELATFTERATTVEPATLTATVGVTPADNIAAVLFAHRDPTTLAWLPKPRLTIPTQVLPVDVPPWWRMKKKNAMFYNAAGRGDHARIMMTASTLCTDSVPEAQAIDAYFPDVAAYVKSLSPPKNPHPTNAPLATRGKGVFQQRCARCHGTYDPGTADYPNLLVGVDEVGTDSTLAVGSSQFASDFVAWFDRSFYGQIARLEPAPGYVAPPLDGIWATAPYLHNGSVPTLAALLDSSQRPRYWRKTPGSFDPDAVGLVYEVVDHGQAQEPFAALRKTLYDTTLLGYGNGGHTYGDALSADDRAALIEYLKTL
jgi:cytochrome c5